MGFHISVAAGLQVNDRVMSHPGTNGYISTWGAKLSGCQPLPPGA